MIMIRKVLYVYWLKHSKQSKGCPGQPHPRYHCLNFYQHLEYFVMVRPDSFSFIFISFIICPSTQLTLITPLSLCLLFYSYTLTTIIYSSTMFNTNIRVFIYTHDNTRYIVSALRSKCLDPQHSFYSKRLCTRRLMVMCVCLEPLVGV